MAPPTAASRFPADSQDYLESALPWMLGVSMALTGNRHDAEDVVQDTAAKVLVRWRKVSRADNVDGYVRRMLVNTFISGKRKRSAKELISHEVVTADVHVDADRTDGAGERRLADRDQLARMLEQLPPRQRAVLALRYYADLPDDEIAEAIGCSPVTVRVTAHRALGALRSRLEPADESGDATAEPVPATARAMPGRKRAKAQPVGQP